jgi:hypothetical protein
MYLRDGEFMQFNDLYIKQNYQDMIDQMIEVFEYFEDEYDLFDSLKDQIIGEFEVGYNLDDEHGYYYFKDEVYEFITDLIDDNMEIKKFVFDLINEKYPEILKHVVTTNTYKDAVANYMKEATDKNVDEYDVWNACVETIDKFGVYTKENVDQWIKENNKLIACVH